MLFPNLTAYHTLENSHGTLDPLGLNSVADRLANRLVPGFRERMKHPRYLTAMTVGAEICTAFDEDEIGRDEVSSPLQVYEWHVTSAFVKQFHNQDKDQLLGMPGREKTTTALNLGVPLTADRYLKTPSVFGFQGVYRTLAKQMNLVDGNRVGEVGVQLIDIWEKEQRLTGFTLKAKGSPGGDLRRRMEEAISKGLGVGAVAVPWTWKYYESIATSLAPKDPGKREANLIHDEIINGNGGTRRDLINFIASSQGQKVLENGSESKLHRELIRRGLGDRNLLLAIEGYEKYCRLLHNAFYQILSTVKRKDGKGKLDEFIKLPLVKQGADQAGDSFQLMAERFENFGEETRMLSDTFRALGSKSAPKEWVRLLLEHHFAVQRKKIPSGKAPWLLEEHSGNYLLNSFQEFDHQIANDYVHQYRLDALYSFLFDLGKLN